MTTNTKKTQEALRMALEAFEADASNENFLVLKHCVREALAHAPTEREQPAQQWTDEPPCKTGSQCTSKCQQCEQQEPVAYDKTEINCFAQDLYDQKMRESKRGHYESMFHVIHQCIKKVSPPNVPTARASKPWVGLTRDEIADLAEHYYDDKVVQVEEVIEMAEAKLRERNEHWEKNA